LCNAFSVEEDFAIVCDLREMPSQRGKAIGPRRLLLLAALLAISVLLYVVFRDRLTLEALAAQELRLLEFGAANPALVVASAFAVYVAVTGLSLPGALALTIATSWLFARMFGEVYGFIAAVVLVSFASTLGATIAFLVSRYLFRDAVQARFGQYLSRFNAALEAEGAYYLFTLRLVPYVPFFVINLVMGLTPIRTRTFWWVSQLGMLAGTMVYVYAGCAIPSLQEMAPRLKDEGIRAIVSPPILVALVLLGLFPIAVKKFVSWRSGRASRDRTI